MPRLLHHISVRYPPVEREWKFGHTSVDFRTPTERAWKIGLTRVDIWTQIEREWIFGRNLPQKPQKPSKYPLSISDRPKILVRPSLAYLSSLIRL